MNARTLTNRTARSSFSFVIALLVISTMGSLGAQASPVSSTVPPVDIGAPAAVRLAADVTGQLSDNQLTSGDLGVALTLVSSDTVVHTLDDVLAGPAGVLAFTKSLKADYPDAQFVVTEFNTIGSLLIVEWQGTVDGMVVFPGRTLATIDNGTITDVRFLNLNNTSPLQDTPFTGPTASNTETSPLAGSLYVIVDEQGNAIAPEAMTP